MIPVVLRRRPIRGRAPRREGEGRAGRTPRRAASLDQVVHAGSAWSRAGMALLLILDLIEQTPHHGSVLAEPHWKSSSSCRRRGPELPGFITCYATLHPKPSLRTLFLLYVPGLLLLNYPWATPKPSEEPLLRRRRSCDPEHGRRSRRRTAMKLREEARARSFSSADAPRRAARRAGPKPLVDGHIHLVDLARATIRRTRMNGACREEAHNMSATVARGCGKYPVRRSSRARQRTCPGSTCTLCTATASKRATPSTSTARGRADGGQEKNEAVDDG